MNKEIKIDTFVKISNFSIGIIPAKAGIQCFQTDVDSGLSPE
jgi:hypothetical protein